MQKSTTKSKMGRPKIDLSERAKSKMENSDDFYTPYEVADKLRVYYRTILNQIKAGDIKATKVGNQYRIRKKDIDL